MIRSTRDAKQHAKASKRRYLKAQERLERDRRQAQQAAEALQRPRRSRFWRRRCSPASGRRCRILLRLPTPRPAPHQQVGDTAHRPPRRRPNVSAALCRKRSRR